jgi:hypothetical protein
MKTKQTERSVGISALFRLRDEIKDIREHSATVTQFVELAKSLDDLRQKVDQLRPTLASVKPIKGQPHGAILEVDLQTKRQMAAEAQALGLRSADELAQIVCRAFVDLCEEDSCITFPLMLQQVKSV